ncbi:MAG: hypothetical protein K2J58_04165 [Muribaculaceae bacterium]|nr:hypothetical protein [Muribaculaceae bacterium]
MKKLLLFGLAMGWILTGNAQVISENAVIIDAAEDTTQVSTINDIVVMQEKVSSRNITDAHIANVWSRKSFFNPGYVSSTLSSKDNIALAPGDSRKLSLKSAWGAQIQLGHSYTLHRGAIANMVQINLDYTYIDLTGNGYDEDASYMENFHPDKKTPQGYQYEAWGSKKYAASYGMSLGPSVTVAPFTMLNSKGLHFIKINGYFHVGYNVGGILYNHKYDFVKDANGNSLEDNNHIKGTQQDVLWGHGWSTSFGFSLSWKSIGIGWESRTTDIKYESTHPSRFGKDKTPLKNSTSRIYLSIKY